MVRTLLMLTALASTASAQEATTGILCEDRGTNGMVSALVCPSGLDSEALAKAGRTICDGRIDCGAWIWTDPDKVPTELPNNHEALSGEAIGSAIAIWVEGQQNLILLEKVAK